MTVENEPVLEMAERHVRESEKRIAHQEAILAELKRDGHTGRTIELGEELLVTLRETLELERRDLERERGRALLRR